MPNLAYLFTLTLLARVHCLNFPYESVQLRDADVGAFSDIAFGNISNPKIAVPSGCKEYPGSPGWPSQDEWARLNQSLGGSLLKPAPPASVCYHGPRYNEKMCDFLLYNASTTRFYLDDPVTVLSQWAQGESCVATLNSHGSCTQGGFPDYVVNASSVKHIQIAVNFARNRNIRLVIK